MNEHALHQIIDELFQIAEPDPIKNSLWQKYQGLDRQTSIDVQAQLQRLDSLELEIDELEEKLCSETEEYEAILAWRSLRSAQTAYRNLEEWFLSRGLHVLIDAEQSFRHSVTQHRYSVSQPVRKDR